MHERAFLSFLISSFCGGILSVVLLRPLTRDRVLSTMPFYLQTASLVFLFGLSYLPEAFPGVFERALGHSIYRYDPVKNGTWVAESWMRPLLVVGLAGTFVGLVWAIFNLTWRRAVYLNVSALVCATVWLVLAGGAYFVPRI